MVSEHNLQQLEAKICTTVRQYASDNVLRWVHNALRDLDIPNSPGRRYFPPNQGGFSPFIAAGIASFSIRHSNPYRSGRLFGWRELAYLFEMVKKYLLADPITFDPAIREDFYTSNPVFMMLRQAASQFPFKINLFGCYTQPLILFGKMPAIVSDRDGVPEFDFNTEFQKTTGLPLEPFIDVGFVAWAASKNRNDFTRGDFQKAGSQGLNLPDDEVVCAILKQITADPLRFREEYEKCKEKDRRFCAYDFNPLFSFPIIRPWKYSEGLTMDRDHMIAPVPDLVAYRFSTGIFYQMFNEYGTRFADYFGHLFEAYVGHILKNSVPPSNLLSESDIRRSYREQGRKVPDWVVIDGATALLIECKSTRFSRSAIATGAKDAINASLKQVRKGLVQLHEFMKAAQAQAPGIELLHHCTAFKPILVSFEPLYLINSLPFRQHINNLLTGNGVNSFPWQILSIKELECLQPHLAAGVRLGEVMRKLEEKTFPNVHNELVKLTGRKYHDSFLYLQNIEMYRRLGVTGQL